MKFEIDKELQTQLKLRFEGHRMRVGILKNGRHQPAAPKSAGLTSALGGPARKTQKARLAEVNKKLAKMRASAKAARGQAKTSRRVASSLKAAGFKRLANLARGAAKSQSKRASKISAKGKLLRASRRKPAKATLSIRQVLEFAQAATGINVVLVPFQKQSSAAYRTFINAYMAAAAAKKPMGHVKKLLLDVVRLPILGRKYGSNSRATIDNKGFNRKFIDTGQVVKALSAEITATGRNS